jgi:3-hexulose-6-phosphate synthase/6-phospho-3-hexuloisomerase
VTDAATSDPLASLFEGLLTGDVSDAMEQLGLRRAVILGYTALGTRGTPVVGRAFTLRQLAKHGADERAANLSRQIEASRERAQPGDIVVIDTGGIADVATWGELHSVRCLRRGVKGMITNGATRDAELIREMKFPVFCRALSPVNGVWDLETRSFDEPVVLEGVQIRPGDIIVADETGIVVVARERAHDVAQRANEIRASDAEKLREERALFI